MRKIKSGIGSVFVHRLFTHLIRPSEEQERKRKEKGGNGKKGGEGKIVARSMETLKGDWWTGPLHLSRPFRESFAALSRFFPEIRVPICQFSESLTTMHSHQRVRPFVPKIHKHTCHDCHDEKII
jgi:hypothetical protein